MLEVGLRPFGDSMHSSERTSSIVGFVNSAIGLVFSPRFRARVASDLLLSSLSWPHSVVCTTMPKVVHTAAEDARPLLDIHLMHYVRDLLDANP
eukprot:m.217694 g.217694  ORF g.217694 m.217694 type:complete len:94 (-) comp15563_c0_seq2:679-960(-)